MVQVPYKKPLSKKLYPLWFMLPFIVLVFTFFILPCFLSVYMAFTDWNITFDPQYVGLKNFQRIFKDPYFTKILGNTLVFVVISEILVEGLAIFIAILTQYFVKNKMSRYVYRTIWLSMNALPSLVYVLVMKAVFGGTSDGIMNRLLLNMGVITEPIALVSTSAGRSARLYWRRPGRRFGSFEKSVLRQGADLMRYTAGFAAQ